MCLKEFQVNQVNATLQLVHPETSKCHAMDALAFTVTMQCLGIRNPPANRRLAQNIERNTI